MARYLTELPPKKVLEKKLHDAIALATERFSRLSSEPQEPVTPQPNVGQSGAPAARRQAEKKKQNKPKR